MDTIPSADEILGQLAPSKSKIRYTKAWEAFQTFLATGSNNVTEEKSGENDENRLVEDSNDSITGDLDLNRNNGQDLGISVGADCNKENRDIIPGEEDYIRYFYYLYNAKKLKSSSLWSIYIAV